jgi:N-methylhydantoinase A
VTAGKRFGVDVGGTFTDIVVLDEETGALTFAKTSTTSRAPRDGVLEAVCKADLDLAEAELFFHGTTLGLNTVLERKGARVGVITSRGFRDALEIGRMSWPLYRLHWDQPPPLVPRHLRRAVTERVRADGTVVAPLDDAEVRSAIEALLEQDVETIAVCFLHAYLAPAHERRVGEIIEAEYPGVGYTLSHVVSREYREYERTATTVVDAMVKSRMTRYVDALEGSLADRAFAGSLLVTRCDGGVMGAREVAERSVRSLISGPASGIAGAATLGRWLGLDKVLAVDMGGTSFDAGLVIDGQPSVGAIAEIGGVPLLMPVIELATIGAGGGSIAWIDDGGAPEVGPQSAGAEPGPICYGRGGTEPTFTDAALVSGLLDGDAFLGGQLRLDPEAAARGIAERIARPLGLSTLDAAAGVVALTEAKMAATLEEISVGKGHNPRDFTLLAYGGGGPLIAGALAARLEIPTVVVPPSPGTFSAWGMLTLDVVHDFSRTRVGPLEGLDAPLIARRFAELEAEGDAALERERIPAHRRRCLRSIDMRYQSQEHALPVPITGLPLESDGLERLRRDFDERHRAAYGYQLPDPVEVVAFRVRAVGTLDNPPRPACVPDGSVLADAVKGVREATHRESGGAFEWTVYDRARLRPDHEVTGPAIVEEPSATTLVGPTKTLRVDGLGNMLIRGGT